MGQVIDLEQRRRGRRPEQPNPGGDFLGWRVAQAAYVDTVVLPSFALWRSVMATCAGFWLAPMGLEVRPVDVRRPPAATERVSSTR